MAAAAAIAGLLGEAGKVTGVSSPILCIELSSSSAVQINVFLGAE